jgi:hypothetical protein
MEGTAVGSKFCRREKNRRTAKRRWRGWWDIPPFNVPLDRQVSAIKMLNPPRESNLEHAILDRGKITRGGGRRGAATISIMTLSMMTFGIKALGIKNLRCVTLSIKKS